MISRVDSHRLFVHHVSNIERKAGEKNQCKSEWVSIPTSPGDFAISDGCGDTNSSWLSHLREPFFGRGF